MPAAPLFDVGRMLMHADRGGVDHLQIAVVGLRDRLEDPVPDAVLAPSDEAVVAGRRRTVALGNVGPGRARPQPPVDAVQHPPVIGPRHAARLVRQQRLDDRPFEIGQFVAAWGHDGSFEELESHLDRRGNPFYEFVTGLFVTGRPRRTPGSVLVEKGFERALLTAWLVFRPRDFAVSQAGFRSGTRRFSLHDAYCNSHDVSPARHAHDQ